VASPDQTGDGEHRADPQLASVLVAVCSLALLGGGPRLDWSHCQREFRGLTGARPLDPAPRLLAPEPHRAGGPGRARLLERCSVCHEGRASEGSAPRGAEARARLGAEPAPLLLAAADAAPSGCRRCHPLLAGGEAGRRAGGALLVHPATFAGS
jgi:hypothetical protein